MGIREMTNPFDYVNSITFNKNDMMSGTENDELAEKSYVPFVVNRALSYFPDTLQYANEINGLHHADNKLQYHYLINTIRPKRRFSKWAKKQEDNDLDVIMQYYGYNRGKAESALSLLSPEQLEQIKKRLNRGGST
jgi:hypothetical protein